MSGGAIRSVKGTRDLLPPETEVWAAVEATARRVFSSYGYGEIRTPVLEETELFVRGVGEGTDIVGKEMYTFADKKGRSLTLRPESTAAVARAFVEHGMAEWPTPVKLYYIGPHFRYERPQRGRYRQFFQIGAELVGDEGPLSDAELLLMLVGFLGALEFDDLVVRLNTLGDEAARSRYRAALTEYLRPFAAELSDDSRRRLDENPLRILDTKAPRERELLAGAPRLDACLDEKSREHFATVRRILDRFEVAHSVEPGLVRGLDYYTSTVFEIASAGLGAQDAIVGGGRYDGLIADLGGPAVPAIGFAIGQDRLIDVLPESFRRRHLPRTPVVVTPAGLVDAGALLALAGELRSAGLAVTMELTGRSVKAALKRAHRSGVRFVVLAGEEELELGRAQLKDLETGTQTELPRAALAAAILEAT